MLNTVSTLLVSAFTLTPAPTQLQAVDIQSVAKKPAAVLNEVMFDALGPAGGDNAYQWVEVAIDRRVPDGSDWSLCDEYGQHLVDLPALDLAPGSFVTVLFGPTEATLEDFDQSDGVVAFTSGHGWGQALGVESGGVQLMRKETLADSLYWGAAVGVPHFDLSFSAEQLISEGESLGRSSRSSYTSTNADWSVSGGENANGATPGSVNLVELPDKDTMLEYQQNQMAEHFIIAGNNFSGLDWLQLVDSTPTIDLYLLDSAFPDRVFMRSNADIEVSAHGVTHFFTGHIETTFERVHLAHDVSETWTSTGTLWNANTDYGISFADVVEFDGAHGLTWSQTSDTATTWWERGVGYSQSAYAELDFEWISGSEFRQVDTRTGQDYGGAGEKTAHYTTIQTRLGDGHYRTSIQFDRSWPIIPPLPGGSQFLAGIGEVLSATSEFTVDASGVAYTGSITAYDHSFNGAPWAQLQAGQVGTISSAYTFPSDIEMTWEQTTTMPLVNALGNPINHTANINYSMELTPTFVAGGGGALPQVYSEYGEVDHQSNATASSGSTLVLPKTKTKPREGTPADPKPGRSSSSRAIRAGTIALSCGAGAYYAAKEMGTFGGKKAVMTLVGKSVGKRAIPVLGQAIMIGCACYGIYDFIWGE